MKNIVKIILTVLISTLCLSTAYAKAEAEPYSEAGTPENTEIKSGTGWLKKEMHFADTLHTPWKIDQFMKAVEVAPKAWVYKELIWRDETTVSIIGMRFNDSMVQSLKSDIVMDDDGLMKRMSRLYKLLRPLNATLDLTIGYKKLPEGLAISYDIANLKIGGGRKKD